MSVQEIKEELRHMDAPVLQELSTYILQLRRSLDLERKKEITEKLNSSNWVSLEEMDKRLDEA